MAIDPSTPVVVGVGQVTNRPHSEGEGSLADRPEPLGLMLDAVGAAVEDCDGAPAGGARPGRAAAARTDPVAAGRQPAELALRRPRAPCWPRSLGIEPAQLLVTTTGGNNPQTPGQRHRARHRPRASSTWPSSPGPTAYYTQAAARRHAGPSPPALDGPAGRHRAAHPVRQRPPGHHRRRGGARASTCPSTSSPCSRTPCGPRPVARLPEHRRPHRRPVGPVLGGGRRQSRMPGSASRGRPRSSPTPTEANRMVAYPYTKLLTANLQVDQGAAVILCSVAAARGGRRATGPLGLPAGRGRRRRPLVPLPPRRLPLLAGHPAGRAPRPWRWPAPPSTSSDHVDLYSCFPSAVADRRRRARASPTTTRPGP